MMWGYPNQYGYGRGGGAWAGLAGAFGCALIFTLIFVILYLWLFYRIFEKAGYSGWYTLLNLIPYVGTVIVVFMLAFGDWPALRGRGTGYGQGPGGYGQGPGAYGQGPGPGSSHNYPPPPQSGYTGQGAPPPEQPASPTAPYPPAPAEQPPYGPEPPVAP